MELKDLGRVVEEGHSELLREIFSKLNLDFNPEKTKFVGNHPISLTLDNIPLLLSNDYMVCEKTDGVRALMYIRVKDGKTSTYFYDRKNQLIEVDYGFEASKSSLFDGEIFYDDETNLRYALFDCILFEDTLVSDKNFLKRLFYCETFVKNLKKHEDEPTKRLKQNNDISKNKIDVYVKPTYKSYGFLEIYRQIKNLKHGNDGLVFTPVDEPYVFQKRVAILKWKPPSINTVDLKIEKIPEKEGVYALKCSYTNTMDLLLDYYIPEDKDGDIVEGAIGEFKFDSTKYVLDYENLCVKQGGWVLYKIRTDKDTPNHYRVVVNILNSLDENLDIEELSRYFKPMRSNYKLREEQRKLQAQK
ncbi:mRNA-capping enzyme subunit alpha [Nosema granulosis]|uniref:mRNA guanylyltransferase n=1 Tax=Nosema granulosis TaxID=83296 RepID=A0A9P6KYS8_9MICR|nr:mRNA-capping enzyme subunit alpha [Nosema granulosis]